jgi:hypothetical protein
MSWAKCSDAGAPRGHSGLTPLERTIMDAVDDGMKIRDIAALVGRQPRAVAKIISTYDGRGDDARARRAAQTGSAMLAAAISHHFPQRTAA